MAKDKAKRKKENTNESECECEDERHVLDDTSMVKQKKKKQKKSKEESKEESKENSKDIEHNCSDEEQLLKKKKKKNAIDGNDDDDNDDIVAEAKTSKKRSRTSKEEYCSDDDAIVKSSKKHNSNRADVDEDKCSIYNDGDGDDVSDDFTDKKKKKKKVVLSGDISEDVVKAIDTSEDIIDESDNDEAMKEKIQSHKAARKARQAAKKGIPVKERKLRVNVENRPAQGEFEVWVGNLAFKTNEEKLREFFSNCGKIARVLLPLDKSGESIKGWAYVNFDCDDAVERAVCLTESKLQGRSLLIKSAKAKRGAGRYVHVHKLNYATTKNDLISAAETLASGEVSRIYFPTIQNGQNKGYSFIYFNDDDAIDRCVSGFEGYELDGFKIRAKAVVGVAACKEDSKQKQPEKGSTKKHTSSANEAESDNSVEKEPTATLFLGNLGFDTKEGQIKIKLNNRGARAGLLRVRMPTFEDSGKCKGFAFIDYTTPVAATAALPIVSALTFSGREVRVQYAGQDAVRRGWGKSVISSYTKEETDGDSAVIAQEAVGAEWTGSKTTFDEE